MTSAELAVLASVLTAFGTGFFAFAKWAIGLWAEVRRDEITAMTARATADRESDARLGDRHVAAIDRINATVNDHTTRDIAAQAEVKQAVVRVEAKFDTALGWIDRERTPVGDVDSLDRPPSEHSERRRRRIRTGPEGNPTR